MNTGVEILLRRMETHPEEFTPPIQHGTSKWADLIHAYKDHIDAEDYEALKLGMKKVLQDKFTERVMQMLAGVDETSEQGKSLTSSIGMGGATLGTWGNRTALSNTLTIGETTVDESMLKHLKAHLDAHEKLTKPKVEVNKKPLIKRIIK